MLLLESGLAYCALCVRVLLFGQSDRVSPLNKVVILVFDILTPNAITHADSVVVFRSAIPLFTVSAYRRSPLRGLAEAFQTESVPPYSHPHHFCAATGYRKRNGPRRSELLGIYTVQASIRKRRFASGGCSHRNADYVTICRFKLTSIVCATMCHSHQCGDLASEGRRSIPPLSWWTVRPSPPSSRSVSAETRRQ